jgi:hypothetical protein
LPIPDAQGIVRERHAIAASHEQVHRPGITFAIVLTRERQIEIPGDGHTKQVGSDGYWRRGQHVGCDEAIDDWRARTACEHGQREQTQDRQSHAILTAQPMPRPAKLDAAYSSGR